MTLFVNMASKTLAGTSAGTTIVNITNETTGGGGSGSGPAVTAAAPLAISASANITLAVDSATLAVDSTGNLKVAPAVTGSISAAQTGVTNLGTRASAIESNVSQLQSSVASQTSGLSSTNSTVTGLASTVSAQTTTLTSLQNKLTTDESNIATNASNITTNMNAVAALQSTAAGLQPLNSNLTALSSTTPMLTVPLTVPKIIVSELDVGATAYTVDTDGKGVVIAGNGSTIKLQPSKGSATGQVSIDSNGNLAVPGTVAGVSLPTLSTTVSSQGTTLASQSASLTSLGNTVSSNTANITTLQGQVVTAGTGLTNSSGALNVNPTQPQITSVGGVNIATLNSSVTSNTSDISSLKSSRTADEASITTLQGQVVTAGTGLTSSSGALNVNPTQPQITSVAGVNIGTLNSTVTTNTTDITSLKSSRTTDEANIAQNTSDISTLKTTTTQQLTTVDPGAPGSVLFPPNGTGTNAPFIFTSNPQTVKGMPYGNGKYTFAQSSSGGTPPYAMLCADMTYSTYGCYGTASLYAASTGVYAGTVSTTVGGTAYPGEWVSVTLPAPKKVTAIAMQTGPNVWAPVSFVVVGTSVSGATTVIYSHPSGSITTTPTTFAVTTPGFYTTLQVIVQTIAIATGYSGNVATGFAISFTSTQATLNAPALDVLNLYQNGVAITGTPNVRFGTLTFTLPSAVNSTPTAATCTFTAAAGDTPPTASQLATCQVISKWSAMPNNNKYWESANTFIVPLTTISTSTLQAYSILYATTYDGGNLGSAPCSATVIYFV